MKNRNEPHMKPSKRLTVTICHSSQGVSSFLTPFLQLCVLRHLCVQPPSDQNGVKRTKTDLQSKAMNSEPQVHELRAPSEEPSIQDLYALSAINIRKSKIKNPQDLVAPSSTKNIYTTMNSTTESPSTEVVPTASRKPKEAYGNQKLCRNLMSQDSPGLGIHSGFETRLQKSGRFAQR